MGNNLTELIFFLDRRGSMGGLAEDTIGGFNVLLEKQNSEPGVAIIKLAICFTCSLSQKLIKIFFSCILPNRKNRGIT